MSLLVIAYMEQNFLEMECWSPNEKLKVCKLYFCNLGMDFYFIYFIFCAYYLHSAAQGYRHLSVGTQRETEVLLVHISLYLGYCMCRTLSACFSWEVEVHQKGSCQPQSLIENQSINTDIQYIFTSFVRPNKNVLPTVQNCWCWAEFFSFVGRICWVQ